MEQEHKGTLIPIVKNESGEIVFEGTRILIHKIISRSKAIGDQEEAEREFLDGYPQFTPGHFQAAIRYYETHQGEIDKGIETEDGLRALLQKHLAQRPVNLMLNLSTKIQIISALPPLDPSTHSTSSVQTSSGSAP